LVRPFHDCPFPSVCAGSASQAGRASYTEYAIAERRVTARRRVFDAISGRFAEGDSFEFEMC
jgi:hypothetical protein